MVGGGAQAAVAAAAAAAAFSLGASWGPVAGRDAQAAAAAVALLSVRSNKRSHE